MEEIVQEKEFTTAYLQDIPFRTIAFKSTLEISTNHLASTVIIQTFVHIHASLILRIVQPQTLRTSTLERTR